MKHLRHILTLILTLTTLLPLAAQQLPNNNFEIWKSACGSTEALTSSGVLSKKLSSENRQRPGSEPEYWNGSSVNQKVGLEVTKELITQVDGFSGYGVKLTNVFVGLGSLGSVAPGYITLGTPWVYAETTVSNCDGGTYGGVEFSSRPDAIRGVFKRDDNNDEDSYIVFYSWSGTFTSSIGIANGSNESLIKDGTNVDRAIMGKENAMVSAKGTLIGHVDYPFRPSNDKWEEVIVPIEYENNSTPSMMNIVVCDGNYWTRSSLVEGTTLYVDDVKLIYYSRLADLKINGDAIPGFGSENYNYTGIWVDEIPTEAQISATALGNSGMAKITKLVEAAPDGNSAVITITVENSNAGEDGVEDIDGKKSHTYTVNVVRRPKTDIQSITINGKTFTPDTQNPNEIIAEAWSEEFAINLVDENENTTKEKTEVNKTADNPTITVTVSNPDALKSSTYTIKFWPFKAELDHISIDGKDYAPEGDVIKVDDRFYENVREGDVTLTPKTTGISGSPTATYNHEAKTVTVTNTPAADRTYTVEFKQPASSRINGLALTVGDREKTLSVDPNATGDPIEIDATSFDLPMPTDAAQIVPQLISSDASVSPILIDTEAGTATFTVTNETGEDLDDLKEHNYLVRFQTPVISRLKTIAVNGNAVRDFSPTTYEYSVASYMPTDDGAITWTFFDGTEPSVTLSRSDSESDNPTITLTVTGSGKDFDGEETHVYTLSFRKLSNINRTTSLAYLKINGKEVAEFNTEGGEFSVDIPYDQYEDYESDFDTSAKIADGSNISADGTTIEVVEDEQKATRTYHVSNEYPDLSGTDFHDYTVHFIPFYSRAVSITAAGEKKPTMDAEGQEIKLTFSSKLPEKADDIAVELPAKTAGTITAGDIQLDPENALATVTVSNTKPDTDGFDSHTYRMQFAMPHFSRLAALTVDGTPVEEFAPDAYSYAIPAVLSASTAIRATAKQGGQGEPEVNISHLDPETGIVTITVSNAEPDIDGEATHVYTLTFLQPYRSRIASIKLGDNELTINHDGTPIATGAIVPTDADALNELLTSAITLMTGSGNPTWTATLDVDKLMATITVSNGDEKDTDGRDRHIYRLTFLSAPIARLSEIAIAGSPIAGFDPEKFDYSLSGLMPDPSTITATAAASTGTPVVAAPAADEATATVTITVTNGSLSATYRLQFELPCPATLAAITVGGTPVGGFSPNKFDYDLTDIELPEAAAIAFTLTDPRATATLVRDEEAATATITVSSSLPAATNVYTLRFKAKSTEQPDDPNNPDNPDTPTNPSGTTVYNGTLTIMMMGEDLTGGGQQATVEIEESDNGTCTFRLPDFSLDLGDGPASLGDIVVENVSVTEAGGIKTYSGTVAGMELAEGAIVADVNLSGTVDADGVARMTIGVVWSGINIDVEFNGQAEKKPEPEQPEEPVTPSNPDVTIFDGTLTIMMMGEDLTNGGQEAQVEIEETGNGTCIFRLPDFSLDLGDGPASLGDIVVENVSVTEAGGIKTYSGTVAGMELAEGAIVADVNLSGTVDADGVARMTIGVVWSGINIDVEFNGQAQEKPEQPVEPAEPEWIELNGRLNIEFNAYDITEGGMEATLKIHKDDDGTFTFMLPDFMLALDAACEAANLGDITVAGITQRQSDVLTTYTGAVENAILADGAIHADIKVGATETPAGTMLVTVDVNWITDDGRRVPIMARFTNRPEASAATVEHAAFTGLLTLTTDGEPDQTMTVTAHISPREEGRARFVIEGLQVNPASRAASLGNSVAFSSVAVSRLTDRLTSYDGNNSGISITGSLMVDATLHAIADADDRIDLNLELILPDSGKIITGQFSGRYDAAATSIDRVNGDRFDDDSNAEDVWFDLNGRRVNPDNLRPGIYLRRTGSRTEKVLIK